MSPHLAPAAEPPRRLHSTAVPERCGGWVPRPSAEASRRHLCQTHLGIGEHPWNRPKTELVDQSHRGRPRTHPKRVPWCQGIWGCVPTVCLGCLLFCAEVSWETSTAEGAASTQKTELRGLGPVPPSISARRGAVPPIRPDHCIPLSSKGLTLPQHHSYSSPPHKSPQSHRLRVPWGPRLIAPKSCSPQIS